MNSHNQILGSDMRRFLGLASLMFSALMIVGTAAAQQLPVDTLATAKVRLAQVAGSRWLALIDSARYAASWDSAAASFRAQISQPDWQAAVVAAHAQVDPLGPRRLLGAQYARELPDAPPGEYVVLQYATGARNNTRVIETLTLTLEGTRTWRVVGYFIRPE